MSTTAVAVLVAVAAAVAAAWPLAALAGWRTRRQPLPVDVDAERTVIVGVLNNPYTYPQVAALDADDFTVEAHRDAWRLIVANNEPFDPDAPGADILTYRYNPTLSETVFDRLDPAVAAAVADGAVAETKVLAAGEIVQAHAADRRMFRGKNDWAVSDGVYVRPRRPVTWLRALTAAALTATGFVVAVVTNPHTGGVAAVGYTAALVALSVTATVVALVDHDTLLIDFPTLAVGGVAAVAAAVGYTLVVAGVGRIVFTAAVVVFIAGMFVAVDRIFHRLRGVHGLGGGDVVLVPVAFGVPMLVVGSAAIATWILLAGSLTAIAAHVVDRFRHGADRDVPLAYGPHLMWGWVPAVLLLDPLARLTGVGS